MSPAVQLLETTGSALREALATQDWSAIGALDFEETGDLAHGWCFL